MAEEFEIIRANLLPAAGTITDNDMILIIQGGRPKRALPSAMKGKQGDPGENVFLGVNTTHILWKQGVGGSWQNLLELEKIRGPRGEKPVFRKLAGTLQLKYEDEPDSAYSSIFDREELKMKFSDLTLSEKELLKLHFSDLTEADKAELMKPAIDAAKDVRDKMDVITQEAGTLKTDLRQLEATIEENEEQRVNDYSKWQAAEQARENAEQARREAESKREENVVVTVDRLNNLSDHRDKIVDGYWYRWNETTGEYENTHEPANSVISVASFDIDPATGYLNMFSDDDYSGPGFAVDKDGILTVTV